MFMFAQYVLLLSTLLHLVSALPLASRDVVSPPITSPTAATTWYVGQVQTVTWSTTGLPVNQTNPSGMLILGYMYNNSENLMLNSPLATNLNYSVGQAQITVPNVPTGSNYIVVLLGDSGNASPEFTIINSASSTFGVPSTTVTNPSSSSPAAGSTPTSASVSSSPPTVGVSSPSPVTGSTPTPTIPSSQTTGSHSFPVVTITASASPLSAQSNAAWQKHVPFLWTSLSISLALIYFTFS